MDEMKSYPKNLKKFRVKKGITQKEAAKRTGITPHWWGWIEAGKQYPTLLTLKRMCDVIGCQISDLFNPENQNDEAIS
ncbi:MAG: helix-turn-helix transcriptional regulator [Prolixibacteraceae bacterium]|nr:helix-turn-helix transcriptional regulator [Prolixibacteraceae bacterium]